MHLMHRWIQKVSVTSKGECFANFYYWTCFRMQQLSLGGSSRHKEKKRNDMGRNNIITPLVLFLSSLH